MSIRGKFLVFLAVFSLFFLFFTPPSFAKLVKLSEIQNGIFHISPRHTTFSSSTFYNDQWISEDQATEFINTSKVDLQREVDGDYPFSLVDHLLLESDLVLLYKKYYKKQCTGDICFPFPVKAYVSRNDISITQFTNEQYPPDIFINVIKRPEPYRGPHAKKVEYVYWHMHNYEIEQHEYVRNVYFPDANTNAYLTDAYVRNSGNVAVWLHETTPRFTAKKQKRSDSPSKSE